MVMTDWGTVPANRVDQISQTPTITAATYASGDAVGGLLTFSGVGQSGKITSVEVFDLAGNAVAYSLELFWNSGFTATATDAKFDPTDADLVKSVGPPVVIANPEGYNDNGRVTSGAVDMDYKSADGKLYGQLVTWGAPVYGTTADITVKITVRPDA